MRDIKNINKTIIILFIINVAVITFNNKYNSLIQDFESTAKSKEAQINRYIDLSNSFIDLLTINGNNYFKQKEFNDSVLYQHLQYEPDTNTYNLDTIGSTDHKAAGNLTGKGPIPENGTYRNEINLALQYNEYFHSLYNKLPNVAWLYYTSENNFINIYPWISSQDFSYIDDLKSTEYYTYVTPEKNPLRKALWTPVYLDQAGKGLMVSLSSPIYDGDTFRGVVSLDLTNVQLSEMIASSYEIYLIDNTDSIIATSQNIKFEKDIIKFNTLLNESENDAARLKEAETEKIQRLGSNYIYSVSFSNAPWRMFLRVPIGTILYQSFIFILPILLMCILLLFTVFEIEKRQKAEILLQNTLDDLQSYHRLLENAAKFDFLTSTYNRRGFKETFEEIVKESIVCKTPISFIIGDIDNFKKFNDNFGHAAGDRVLIEIANLIKKNLEENDLVCRWGGEEFLIMMFNKNPNESWAVAEDIRKDIESTVIPWENTQELKVTMSFGIAEYKYADSFENSISQADSALYTGKMKGRNQVIVYTMENNQVKTYRGEPVGCIGQQVLV